MEIHPDNIYNMDCTDGMRQMQKESVDLCITDPPFEVNYDQKSKELAKIGITNEKQVERDKHYIEFNINYMCFAHRLYDIMKPDTHTYIYCGTEQIFKWRRAMTSAGFKFRQLLLWVKDKARFSMNPTMCYFMQTEKLLFFSKGTRRLNNPGMTDVIRCDRLKSIRHPAQKPLSTITPLILNSSNSGDIVFDPFLGSGTTALAAKQTNRRYIGFELSPHFYDMAKQRLQQQTIEVFA